MNYTIDAHTKREKVKDEKTGKPIIDLTDDAGKVIKDPDKFLKDHPSLKLKPVARVTLIPGFILRSDDAMVGFFEKKEDAIKQMEKEKKTPSVLPGMILTIESHTKREKVFETDKEGNETPVIDPKTRRVKEILTPGFQLRNENRVVMWSKNREDLVKEIQKVRGISNPKAAEEAARPKKDVTREPKKARTAKA